MTPKEVKAIQARNRAKLKLGDHFKDRDHELDLRGFCNKCKAVIGTHLGAKNVLEPSS